MKQINTMMFITEYTKEIINAIQKIDAAEDFEKAKNQARYTFGLIDGMLIFTNTMICMENNLFTAEMDDVEEGWKKDVYQHLADAASKFHESSDTIWNLLKLRDEHIVR